MKLNTRTPKQFKQQLVTTLRNNPYAHNDAEREIVMLKHAAMTGIATDIKWIHITP